MYSDHSCGVDDHVQSRGAGSSSDSQLKHCLQYKPNTSSHDGIKGQSNEALAVFIMMLSQKRGNRKRQTTRNGMKGSRSLLPIKVSSQLSQSLHEA